MKTRHVVFGPPGTGKTTHLLDEVQTFLARGGDPTRVAFLSYTRAAAAEARDRAAEQFDLSEEELPFFRTLHSLAFRLLGLRRDDVLRPRDYADIAGSLGIPLSGRWTMDDSMWLPGQAPGDECLAIYAWHRARQVPVEDAWRRCSTGHVGLATAREFIRAIQEVKTARNRLDFADMLDLCRTDLPVDLLVVDEAQDLSPAQWALAQRLAASVERVLVAGDDDQAIYDFAGADSSYFQGVRGERIVLSQSHRLSRPVHALAEQVVAQIGTRVPKQYRPAPHDGELRVIPTLALEDGADTEGTQLVLARHNHQLPDIVRWARQHGRVYFSHGRWSNTSPAVRAAHLYERFRRGDPLSSEDAALLVSLVPGASWAIPPHPQRGEVRWHAVRWPFDGRPEWYRALQRLDREDVQYIRAMRARGEPLSGPGRMTISTIHGAKGRQADHVVLLTDISARSHRSAYHTRDAEARVWYVAVTRAKHTLTLVRAHSPRVWPGWAALGRTL